MTLFDNFSKHSDFGHFPSIWALESRARAECFWVWKFGSTVQGHVSIKEPMERSGTWVKAAVTDARGTWHYSPFVTPLARDRSVPVLGLLSSPHHSWKCDLNSCFSSRFWFFFSIIWLSKALFCRNHVQLTVEVRQVKSSLTSSP
jgi:hypothetical protein